ncbi:MAG: HAD-IIA family hydrolase [bacterium]
MFRDCKAVVLDIEGVLFAGKEALPGGREVVETLAARGIPHRYLTNNSRMTAAELEAHMRSLGLPVEAGRIVSVLDRAGDYLRRGSPGGKVFVIGGEALRSAVGAAGFEVAGPGEEDADIVLVGIDPDLTYLALSAAARAVARGARFVALNPDVRAPLEGGAFQLGGGAVAAPVAAAGGRAPECIGKPSPFLFEEALGQLGAAPGEAVMVGDNPRTDVEGARALGIAAVWVNQGVYGPPEEPPDLEVGRVDEILPHLPGG